jgi:quercetin 2,3-dioxygenase
LILNGFNIKIIAMAKKILHRSETRGDANHGWLHSRHTFSFADYFDPERIHFGALRVLNDDLVAGGMGFDTHPHSNMEIVSIPLKGDLEHRDSMGNVSVISEGEIQVMSAGTGIRHSEYNKNADRPVKFLQIWILPERQNVKPRYDQLKLNPEDSLNKFQQILSPSEADEGVWIHQRAWFHLGTFGIGVSSEYSLKEKGNGVYVFILEGEVECCEEKLGRRDGLGISETEKISFTSLSESRILLLEVPMLTLSR